MVCILFPVCENTNVNAKATHKWKKEINLQIHVPGPTCKLKTHRPQSTFLCTDQTHCWHQFLVCGHVQRAWLRLLMEARNYWTMEI